MYYFFQMRKRIFFTTILVVSSLILPLFSTSHTQELDPILNYYVSNADTAFAKSDTAQNASKYSFLAFTYYKAIGRGGVVTRLDSAVNRYFCTGETVDSIQLLTETKKRLPRPVLYYPNVFVASYEHKFFPNDIGSQDLAINFENISELDSLPSGIAVIDRKKFTLRNIYLYYPRQKGYKRLTRSFRFDDTGGFVFPDSIWEVGAKQGVFSTEYYRLETGIEQIQLLR